MQVGVADARIVETVNNDPDKLLNSILERLDRDGLNSRRPNGTECLCVRVGRR